MSDLIDIEMHQDRSAVTAVTAAGACPRGQFCTRARTSPLYEDLAIPAEESASFRFGEALGKHAARVAMTWDDHAGWQRIASLLQPSLETGLLLRRETGASPTTSAGLSATTVAWVSDPPTQAGRERMGPHPSAPCSACSSI